MAQIDEQTLGLPPPSFRPPPQRAGKKREEHERENAGEGRTREAEPPIELLSRKNEDRAERSHGVHCQRRRSDDTQLQEIARDDDQAEGGEGEKRQRFEARTRVRLTEDKLTNGGLGRGTMPTHRIRVLNCRTPKSRR